MSLRRALGCSLVSVSGWLLPLVVLGAPAIVRAATVRAFPSAEGYGALVTGGRGGTVVHVTNLNDTGAGSLRAALSAGNRIVVFDVGGVITIASPLVVSGDNVTVAGQTAPDHGITIYGDGTSASGRTNVVLRYLRFRQGIDSGSGTKALNVTDGSNMIFDHVSVQWGRWDTVGLTGSTKTITIQYSLLGESIDPQRFGGLVDGASEITLSHNLWLDSQSRSPKFKANGQYINNVVYNWGANGLGGGHSGADWYEDLINNLFIKGPSSTGGFATLYASTDHVFNSGNLVDLDLDGKLAARSVVAGDFTGDTPPTFETAAHNVPPVAVTVQTALAAYDSVIGGAGASLCRDAIDLRLITQVKSLGTKGAIITDETLVGGQPSMPMVARPAGFDTDRDGIADAWETAHGLNPNSASDASADADGDGYSNLEAYLNELGSAAADSCGTAAPNNGGGGAGGTGGGAGGMGAGTAGSGPSDSGGLGGAPDSTNPSTAGGGSSAAGASNAAGGNVPAAGATASGAAGSGNTAGQDQNAAAGAAATDAASGCSCSLGARSEQPFALSQLAALLFAAAGVSARRRRR
jgi:pectate lyase